MRVRTRRTRLSRARRTRHSALDEHNADHAPIDDVPAQMSSAPRPSQRQGRHGQRHGLTTAKSTQWGVHTRRARHYSRTHEQTQTLVPNDSRAPRRLTIAPPRASHTKTSTYSTSSHANHTSTGQQNRTRSCRAGPSNRESAERTDKDRQDCDCRSDTARVLFMIVYLSMDISLSVVPTKQSYSTYAFTAQAHDFSQRLSCNLCTTHTAAHYTATIVIIFSNGQSL